MILAIIDITHPLENKQGVIDLTKECLKRLTRGTTGEPIEKKSREKK